MAVCPKCRKKLKIWHISQYCPYCGTNIVFHSFEANFEKDKRIAEMSMAAFRVKLEKAKKAYVSGWPQKLKIAACVLPLAGLFIPFGSLSVSTSLLEKTVTFWVMDMVYNAFMGEGYYGAFAAFTGAPVFGAAAAALRTAMLCFTVMAVCALVILLTELFCFAGNKRTGAVITACSVLGISGAVGARIFCGTAVKAANASGGALTGSVNALFLIPVLLFVFAAVMAILCLKHPPVIEVKEGDKLRMEYREKLHNGEIELMDIPSPIYESEEDKKEKERLIKGAYHMDEAEEVSENG